MNETCQLAGTFLQSVLEKAGFALEVSAEQTSGSMPARIWTAGTRNCSKLKVESCSKHCNTWSTRHLDGVCPQDSGSFVTFTVSAPPGRPNYGRWPCTPRLRSEPPGRFSLLDR